MQNYLSTLSSRPKGSSNVKNKDGISVLKVYSSTSGVELAKREIYKIVDERTALFLSGGSTPKPLYQILAKEGKLKVGAVAMVDERFGPSFHQNSNEKMIKDTGLLSYLESRDIPLYGILKNKSLGKTARDYDSKVRKLLNQFPKSIAILGIGEDGHTASLRAGIQNSKVKSQKLAISIKDFPGEFRERITLTFHALSQMDLLIVLVFGKEKRKALNLMFSGGPIGEIPARFLNTPKVLKKNILITDKRV